jgi:soluble lytic murein transglycosylase
MKTALSAGLVCLLSVAALRAEVDLPGERLGQLAARAVEKHAWGALRHYAESGLDSERRGQAYFVLGYREYEAREYPAAAEDLRRAQQTGFSLADFATYYGASAARQAGQSDQAIQALDGFSGRYAGSTLRFDALALLADLWLETGQAERAIGALTAESQVRQRPPLALLLARAYREARQPGEAARRFQEVYYAFPASAESKAAGDALHQLRAELGANFPEVSEDIETARAALLYAKSLVNDALSDYEVLLQAYPGSRLVPRWKIGRGQCLVRLKQADRAVELLQEQFATDPEADAQRLATLVEAHLQRADTTAMLQTVEQLRALYPQSASCASALSLVGNHFVREGDWKTASSYYEPLAQGFPDSDFAAEASWRVAWARYLRREATPAAEALVNHLARYPDSPRVPAALYWLGRMAAERGATAEARAWYVLLQTRFVHSYYALQATQRLAELGAAGESREKGEEFQLPTPATGLEHLVPPRPPAPVPACAPATPSETLWPFLTLKALSLEDLGEQYLLALLAEHPEASELLLALSRLKAEQRNPAAALLDAGRAVPRYAQYKFSELPQEAWNLLYPRDYWALVRRQARANGLDPYLVMGLIRQESAFNPRATSSANARGLMQILPQTASRSRRGRARVARRLYEPAYNVRFGCRHLRDLLKVFDRKPEQALAAYHAGSSRVKEWLGKYSFREPAEFMETISIPATRTYLRRVLRDAAIYRQLMRGTAKFAKCQPTAARSGGRSRQGPPKQLP